MSLKMIHYIEQIRPGGGPRGYLNNLNEQIKNNNSSSISVMYRYSEDNRQQINNSVYRKIGFTGSIQRLVYYFLFGFRDSYKFTNDEIIELSKAKIIVFHRRAHLDAYLKKAINREKQTILIMPHNPLSPAEESIQLMPIKHGWAVNKIWRLITKILCKKEIKSFNNANGILLASENSTESYYEPIQELKVEFNSIKRYIINSGVNALAPNKETTAKTILPEPTTGKIKICYFGRYENIKGYDIFIDLAKSHEFTDCYSFISAGSGSKSIDSFGKYFNLGWRNDIADLIYCSDVVVVPNRASYFDLVILESISLGKPVITSNIGGGRDIHGPGIYKFNNMRELKDILLSNKYLLDCPSDIKENFARKYSSDAMLSRYEALASSICKGL